VKRASFRDVQLHRQAFTYWRLIWVLATEDWFSRKKSQRSTLRRQRFEKNRKKPKGFRYGKRHPRWIAKRLADSAVRGPE